MIPKQWTVFAAALCALAATPALQDDPLARLRWLAGCWELHRGTLVTTSLREWEQLRLSVREGRVVYTAAPSGRSLTDFVATTVSDSGFAVENPTHDFPQRIIYRRQGADSLIARIEGNTPDGPRGVDYPMRRGRCEAS